MSMTLKRIASCLIVVCLTVAILAGLTGIVENKSSLQKYTQFFQQEEDFDVLFLGSSKVINGVLPMELWNDYGIVSYNLGGHANTIPTSYWVLRNALEHTTPKCVVLDCFGASWNNRISDNFYYTHLSFDAFPLSPVKLQAVLDLVSPEDWEDAREKRVELLWNFSTYHSRWNELTPNDFHPYFTYQKGAEPRADVSIPLEMATVSPELRISPDTSGMAYLIRTIELCRERGIEILLVHLPYPAGEDDLIAANTVRDIAESYGVEYINYLETDIVDYQTDMNDPDSHLNPSGARKITDHLGRVLSERYQIPDQRANPAYGSWYQDAEFYHQEKLQPFRDATSAWCYWMLLADDDFSFLAEISEQDLQQDPVLAALLGNAGIQPEKIQGRCLIAADRNRDAVVYTSYEELSQGPVETALGTLTLEEDRVMLDSRECLPADPAAAMGFALLDADRNLLENAWFSAEEIRSE